MKKVIRRIFLDIKKRKGFWILKILVLSILFSLLLTSFFIYSVSNQLKSTVVQRYNITSTIIASDLYQKQLFTEKEYYEKVNNYLDVVNRLENSQSTDYFDIAFANGYMFPLHVLNDQTVPKEIFSISSSIYDIKGNIQQYYEKNSANQNTIIVSARNPIFLDLKLNLIELSQGRTFSEEELAQGKNVCIVPNYSFIINENDYRMIQLGDMLPITELLKDENGKVVSSKLHEYEVIGFYSPTNGVNVPSDHGQNLPVYIPERNFRELVESVHHDLNLYNPNFFDEATSAKTFNVHQGIFGFDTIEHLKLFLNELDQQETFLIEGYKYFSTINDYYISISNVLSISQSFDIISQICFIACILISIMILVFEITSRKKEIGILLSLGASLKQVLMQLMLELFIITLLAFGTSVFVSQKTAEYGNQYLFNNTLDVLTQKNDSSESYYFNLLDREDEGALEKIIKPQYSKEIMSVAFVYISILFVLEGVVCWILIKRIDPVELLKDE